MRHFIFDLLVLVMKKLRLDVAIISLAAIVYGFRDGIAALPILALDCILLLRFTVWLPIFYRMWTAREGRWSKTS